MTVQDLSANGWVICTLIQLAMGFIQWIMNARFASKDDYVKLKERISVIENRVADLPSKEDLHQLALQIVDLRGELKSVNMRFQGLDEMSDRLERQVDMIEEYLKEASTK